MNEPRITHKEGNFSLVEAPKEMSVRTMMAKLFPGQEYTHVKPTLWERTVDNFHYLVGGR